MDFLWAGGRVLVPVEKDGTEYAPTVSLLGVSLGSGIVRGRRARIDSELTSRPAWALHDWPAADRSGPAILSLVEQGQYG